MVRHAARHVADAARILRPGGALAILNLSYRNDEALDLADATSWADNRHWAGPVTRADYQTEWKAWQQKLAGSHIRIGP